MEKTYKIDWDMLVVGTSGNKKILIPKKENGKYIYDEEMQLFEDMEGKQYAFNFELRTKNSLEYYDRHGNLVKDIFDYPQVLEEMGLKQKDKVTFGTIRRMQNQINDLVEDKYETL